MMQTNKHLRLHFHCVELLSHQFKWTSEHFTQVTLTANNEYVMILMQHSEHDVHTVVLNVGWSSLPTVTPDALHSSVLLWTTPFIYCCFCLRDVEDLPHYMCATRNVSASLQTLTWWRCVSCDPQSTRGGNVTDTAFTEKQPLWSVKYIETNKVSFMSEFT